MPTTDRCNNCACPPPCTWSLCVAVNAVCVPAATFLSAVTVRFQGPGGIDETRTLSSVSSFGAIPTCYANPPAGAWTITVEHPCLKAQVLNATVVQCQSQTISVGLDLPFSGFDYSDDYGSGTIARYVTCRFANGVDTIPANISFAYVYTYTSTHTMGILVCPYHVDQQGTGGTGPVRVYVEIMVSVSDTGYTLTLSRYTPLVGPVKTECPSGGDYWVLDEYPFSGATMRSAATIVVACDGSGTVDESGTTVCVGASGTYGDPADASECVVSFNLTSIP